MKFGCCFSLMDDDILKLPQTGADYAETSLSSLESLSPEQVRERARQLEAAGVAVPVMNVMFPGSLRLTGKDARFSQVDEYLKTALEKASLLGVKKVVFGSGGARAVPEGFPYEEAFEQLVELCRDHIAPAFEARGMVCCAEPLNRKECNILNTCAEAFRLVKAVERPGFRLLVDLYHFDLEQEPLTSLADYKGYLRHAHIASAKNGRAIPHPGDGEDYAAFFRALGSAGYDGELSLEGNMPGGLPEIAASIAYLRSLE